MHIESLRDYCLAKPGTEEQLPFGPDTLVFKALGKIYLLVGLNGEGLRFNVKCDPEKAIELREEYPARAPGFSHEQKTLEHDYCRWQCTRQKIEGVDRPFIRPGHGQVKTNP